MRFLALCVVIWAAIGTSASAQVWAGGSSETPRFETCLPEQMGAFEASISGPAYGVDWQRGAFNVHWVQHCGYLAIGICDVSRATFACQRRLREAWYARADELHALLPAPEDVADLPLAPLYAQVWALAEGQDAGDDCAGWDYRRNVWCRAFEAALKYEEVIWAWQVARLMGVMGPLDWVALSELGDT